MYKLYDFLPSGNSYKVRLLLNQLEIPYERIDVNILNRETRTEEFLKINSNGRIPVLEIENGQHLAESNAILFYLSQGTKFLPQGSWMQAKVLQWLFFEQYSHEPNIATSRYWISILKQPEKYQNNLAKKQKEGYQALDVIESHLAQYQFFVDEKYSIADIALYAYTHVAHEGNFDLSDYPFVRAWLERVARQPNHLKITDA
ncbi:Glutathione S-transferase domain protein [[Leptolyngbya] sp. PCC 7376]|uniref:glutathione S-transferase family protein n=1 Tax=[Leptolyngbya] sp. PCC 7376 TaxID=111781 RepID=UPI00029F2F83|nr:glutathione S-transferase family protein [[Leptolyngbya] sp. PCC 7376]AFY40501.1 Glutathione S-transferase domain protein [[Leptolyngbya] sp. PCC 7376]